MSEASNAAPLRVALVGAGGLGRGWAKVISNQQGAELGAVVDPLIGSERQAEWIVEEVGHLPLATDLEATLEMDIDAAVVTAFSIAHHVAVKAALERGLHVLVEKPFTVTLQEAEELVSLAADKGLTLMVSQNYRYFPGASLLREIVRDERYGSIASVFCEFCLDWPGKPYQHGMQHAMGLEMAVHHFDMCRAIFDAEATGGYAREWQPAGSQYAGGGAIEAVFEMEGSRGTFPFTYSGSLVSKAPRTPWPGRWRFEFDRKTILLDTLENGYGLYACQVEEHEWLGRYDGDTMLFNLPLAHFIDSIRTGKEPWSSGRDNLGTMRMALAAEFFGKGR
ncbi:Gfo/Idh/MocA family protein [Devosia nitrariae]|uniref:Gfo/Idh/MocA family protein n=1 Tax=Devosia nitrariae TaxID=2071872 RepID=UPI0024E1734A|nr:Gfo/Idh/MocA family oxidoreductase [Devosia nitrariae]